MNRNRSVKVWLGLLSGGIAVAGCQAPGMPTFKPSAPQPGRRSVYQPEHVQVSRRALAPATNAKPGSRVLAGIEPKDTLPPCRPTGSSALSLTRYLEEIKPQTKPAEAEQGPAFQLPEGLPGSNVAPFTVPEFDRDEPIEQRQQKMRNVYSKIPELPPLPFAESPDGTMSLAELQKIAYGNSPTLQAAAARVEQARGEAIQAGLCPNPEVGYAADTINTGDTAGYNGVFVSQTFVTADKLKIARSVEWQDVLIAEYELRQTEIDLATAVRENYFQALVAQERLKFARGLINFFTETYQAQIELVVGGEAAPYEPLQIRVFAVQAQNEAIQAANLYLASWRQLAAVLNAPHLTPHELEGSPEMPVPEIAYEQALDILLSRHTDLAIAQTQIQRSELDVWLQRRKPIPNVNFEGAALHDDTSVLNDMAFNLQVGLPLPIFNKNQGNIYTAQSQLVENHSQLTATQNDLAARLAEIYARYTSNRQLAANYRDQIIPDQVRTYRSTYQRYRQGADTMDFAQIVTSQQQLGQVIREYVDVLGNQWQAVVDLAEILQADDVFALSQAAGLPPEAHCPPEMLQVPPVPE